jgi:hypothetical protein
MSNAGCNKTAADGSIAEHDLRSTLNAAVRPDPLQLYHQDLGEGSYAGRNNSLCRLQKNAVL